MTRAPMNDHSPMRGFRPPLAMYVVMRCRMVTLAKVMNCWTVSKPLGLSVVVGLKLLKSAWYL